MPDQSNYGPCTEPEAFKAKEGALIVIKAPKRGGGEQVMFLEPSEAVVMSRKLSELLGVQMSIPVENVKDNDNELINIWNSVNLNTDRINTIEEKVSALKTLFGKGGE